MQFRFVAACALIASSSLSAEAIPDLGTSVPIAGNWTYSATGDGSEASFANAFGVPQILVHCMRATRQVSIAKAATAAAPLVNVWTSSLTRSVASNFNAATGRLTIDLSANDPLLDALANSRGRLGFIVGTESPLVVPAWAEAARVIEDCRA